MQPTRKLPKTRRFQRILPGRSLNDLEDQRLARLIMNLSAEDRQRIAIEIICAMSQNVKTIPIHLYRLTPVKFGEN